MLAVPATSQAWSQSYCGVVLQPNWGSDCASNYPHSLDRTHSWYPGAAAHHVRTCTFLWNYAENHIRGYYTACKFSDVGNGVAEAVFDPTTNPTYRAWAYLSTSCCPHTVNAYTATTY
jgi:hypothetical protein